MANSSANVTKSILSHLYYLSHEIVVIQSSLYNKKEYQGTIMAEYFEVLKLNLARGSFHKHTSSMFISLSFLFQFT